MTNSPRLMARIAGFFYLLVFVTGGAAFSMGGKLVVNGDPAATAANLLEHATQFQAGWVLNLLATVFYVVVTALFYALFKPAGRTLSLAAAFFSLVGCAIGAVSSALQLAPLAILKGGRDPIASTVAYALLRSNAGNVALIFFGFYCLLIGCLVLRSTFMPRIVGIAMLIASLGWLTFLWPPLAAHLAPFNFLPGMLGEAVLTLWLLVKGVNAEQWRLAAGRA